MAQQTNLKISLNIEGIKLYLGEYFNLFLSSSIFFQIFG
jgi:hypothetical protein